MRYTRARFTSGRRAEASCGTLRRWEQCSTAQSSGLAAARSRRALVRESRTWPTFSPRPSARDHAVQQRFREAAFRERERARASADHRNVSVYAIGENDVERYRNRDVAELRLSRHAENMLQVGEPRIKIPTRQVRTSGDPRELFTSRSESSCRPRWRSCPVSRRRPFAQRDSFRRSSRLPADIPC